MPSDQPSFFTRLRVMLRLLAGLRRRDLQSAVRFMNERYSRDPLLLRFLKLNRWALRIMWRDIPESLPWVTIDETISHTPYWLTTPNPLANVPWAENPEARLPQEVEVAVVGAGFGGAAVAYHWSKHGDKSLVVLEANEAASGSAGRNGGIMVMAGGHLHGYYVYEQVTRHLAEQHPQVPAAEREERAVQFSDAYVKALHANHEMARQTIEDEGIDCDYVRRGWVFFTDEVARESMEASLSLAERRGYTDWVRRTSEQVRERCGAATALDGAESLGSATWHPAKWVWGILGKALQNPNVALFTHTPVRHVEAEGARYRIHTDRGTIRARHVVNAVESHTPSLFRNFLDPFPDLIKVYKEQAMYAEGGPPSMAAQVGITGPLNYFTRVADGGIVFGSDNTEVAPQQAGKIEPSRFITRFTSATVGQVWEPTDLRVTHEWTGTTSTTPDKYPVIGLMDKQALYIIGGFAGAGSGVSFNAGQAIVHSILQKPLDVDYFPEAFFSPWRFTDLQRYGRQG